MPFSLAIPSSLLVPAFAFFLAGIGIEIFNVLWFSAIQREIPPNRIARVWSLDFLMSYGLAPLGLVAMVPLVETFGIMPVVGAGCLCVWPIAIGLACEAGRRHLVAAGIGGAEQVLLSGREAARRPIGFIGSVAKEERGRD